MTCFWYSADQATAPGVSDYQRFPSFDAALASTAGYLVPDVVWGSVLSYINGDGLAAFVDIRHPQFGHVWTWAIGIVGNPAVASGASALGAQAALDQAEQSGFIPAGFCTESTISVCDPATLIAAARCWRCIPAGAQKEAQIAALCAFAGGTFPAGFLLQSEGGYVVLDDGGRIVIN